MERDRVPRVHRCVTEERRCRTNHDREENSRASSEAGTPHPRSRHHSSSALPPGLLRAHRRRPSLRRSNRPPVNERVRVPARRGFGQISMMDKESTVEHRSPWRSVADPTAQRFRTAWHRDARRAVTSSLEEAVHELDHTGWASFAGTIADVSAYAAHVRDIGA